MGPTQYTYRTKGCRLVDSTAIVIEYPTSIKTLHTEDYIKPKISSYTVTSIVVESQS